MVPACWSATGLCSLATFWVTASALDNRRRTDRLAGKMLHRLRDRVDCGSRRLAASVGFLESITQMFFLTFWDEGLDPQILEQERMVPNSNTSDVFPCIMAAKIMVVFAITFWSKAKAPDESGTTALVMRSSGSLAKVHCDGRSQIFRSLKLRELRA